MSDLQIGISAIVTLFALVLGGVPIAFSLISVSIVAMFLITGSLDLTGLLVSDAALGSVRNYVFVVVPLFVLMGAFMSNSAAAQYLYATAQRVTARLIGGLSIATVFANAIFSAVTGVSVASAAIFARISVPEMLRQGYGLRLALGSVAGSSVLGMLIPPSLLMILYGVLAQVSIGTLFIAGVIPGILLAMIYAVTIVIMGLIWPQVVGRANAVVETAHDAGSTDVPMSVAAGEAVPADGVALQATSEKTRTASRQARADSKSAAMAERTALLTGGDAGAAEQLGFFRLLARTLPILLLIVGVIGGIWLGYFTPTEAAAVGALGALLVAGFYRMGRDGLVNSFRETAISTGAIMLLLISAQMYSRMLARSGMINSLTSRLEAADLSPTVLILVFVVVLILLGAILDSSSILLIMVPLMVPAILVLGENPVWFGIVMIIAIEIGLLTPPFGMVAFSMSAVLGSRVRVEDIFVGSIPFVIAMLVALGLVIAFPSLTTWLPGML